MELAIERKTNRVLYTQSDKDFVDVLLSFLILPMGTIIKVANKRSGIGSMDNLYRSVEALDDEECFRAKASKTMLLNPRSAYGFLYHNLVVKIDKTNYFKIYTCRTTPCLDRHRGLFSLVKNSICYCGQAMNKEITLKKHIGRVFINKTDRYIISDDLKILPALMDNSLPWLMENKIGDSTEVRKAIVTVGPREVLHLLLRLMIARTPLTDVFVLKNWNYMCNSLRIMPYEYGRELLSTSEEMKVKLWFCKSTESILCVEAKADFVHFLFTFLTLPLSSVIKLLNGHSYMGIMDQLYKTAETLIEQKIISTETKEKLLSPKLECMFGCCYQLLQIQEKTTLEFLRYKKCDCSDKHKKTCLHSEVTLQITNPKRRGMITSGGGFVKEGRLLVTDNLEIKPLSTVSDMFKLGMIPFEDMECMYVTVGEEEITHGMAKVLSLLCLVCFCEFGRKRRKLPTD
ncbi:hypothetical protein FEM48_Zijuj01G0323500 [Ziziphus jujuba var. spinosa]|uniref:Uncharacterized protein n=1 Tax=Ziziphus jujuba var. spinosa TaxID=714518 RepID=A0A978W6I3_ZIZJJ|nr:hypothetical protein FEM48_Zijuj01G0323500 [Ziziphus jujuba var. spinosa]